MPPFHSGIVPAALPARSAPRGVRSLPSRAISSAEIAAEALVATKVKSIATLILDMMVFMVVTPFSSLLVRTGI